MEGTAENIRDLDELIYSISLHMNKIKMLPMVKEGNHFRSLTKDEWIILIDHTQDGIPAKINNLVVVSEYGIRGDRNEWKFPDDKFYKILLRCIDENRIRPAHQPIVDF